jgi:hypothetical protein
MNYLIRIEKRNAVIEVFVNTINEMIEIAHGLTQVYTFVQVWQGDKKIYEYDNRTERKSK